MSRSAPIFAGLFAALLLMLGAYLGAYFAMLEGRFGGCSGPYVASYRGDENMHGHRIKWLLKQQGFEEFRAPGGPFAFALQTSF